jgi:hypothetical protein
MKFYPLLEDVRKGSESKTVRDELIKKFPKKYMTHSAGNRVKNSGKVSSSEFSKDIEEVLGDLDLEFSKIEIIPPGRGNNSKSQSDSYDTVHIELTDSARKEFGLILASLSGGTKTSTIFKEGMVCFFASSQNQYEPFKKESIEKISNYFQLMEKIYNEIDQVGIIGLEKKDIKEIKEFLKNKSADYDLNTLNSIFNAMSIGNWIRNSEFRDWEIHRDKLFSDIKKSGGKITKIPEDKWNPMDIILIRQEKEDIVKSTISEVNSEKNRDKALSKLNRLFANNLDNKDPNTYCLAVSLKEAESQHGRAKSYIDSLDVSDKTHYNLSDDEKSWRGKDQKILDEIIKLREDIQKNADLEVFDYRIGGKDISQFTGANPLAKYGALKMTKFFIDYTRDNSDIFANLASYGLSLGVNPTFFKLVGSIDGDYKKVKDEKFEAEGGVVLYDLPDISYDKKIWIIDNPGNSGIQLVYWVMFAGWIYYVQIQIRSSKGPNQITQVDVEIEKFKKLKEI